MANPYKKELRQYQGMENEVTIHRANTIDLIGKISSVEEDGFHITHLSGDPNFNQDTFVAYKDVRGISKPIPSDTL